MLDGRQPEPLHLYLFISLSIRAQGTNAGGTEARSHEHGVKLFAQTSSKVTATRKQRRRLFSSTSGAVMWPLGYETVVAAGPALDKRPSSYFVSKSLASSQRQ